MKLLNHLNPAHYKYLAKINDDWPFQFLSEYSRFYHYYHSESINIAYDKDLNAFIPIRFLNLKLFAPVQILFAPVRDGNELNAQEQKLFFDKLIRLLQKNSICERLVQPQPYGILATVPPHSKYCEFGTYVVDLENQTNEEIFEKFHPKYQKAVAHSIKNNAVVKFGRETLDDFYSVYSKTMVRAQLHIDKFEYFDNIYKFLGDDKVCSAVVYDNQQPVSGIFLIHTNYSAFLTHAGTHGDSKLYGAAKLLNFEAMKHLKAKGVKKYDFVGVRLKNNNPTLEGIFRFKKGFGGDLKEGFLWKIDLLPMKARAYDFVVTLRSGKKGITDIIDQISQ